MCGGKDKDKEQPEIKYSMSPNQQTATGLFNEIQVPFMKSQYGLYKDVFEPQMRQLGQTLGNELSQPMSLPEDVWSSIWNKSRENVVGEYNTQRQSASERAAGSGMLGQGPTEKYFQNLDLSQAKSIESMAVDMAIQQWTEKKAAKQQAIQNMQAFQGYQPNFNLTLPTETAVVTQPNRNQNTFGSAVGGGLQGAALGSMIMPGWGTAIGGGLGALGSIFG